MKEYKRGETIRFKDLREYEVLLVYPSGYMVAGNLKNLVKNFGSDEVRFFRLDYLAELERRNFLAREVTPSTGPSQVLTPTEEVQESPPVPEKKRRGRPRSRPD